MTSPRIVVDLRATQSRHHAERGIARYTNELAAEIERQRPGLITDFLFDPAFPINSAAAWAVGTGRARRTDRIDPQLTAAGGAFLIGSPFEEASSIATIAPPWLRHSQWATTAILYDLIPLIFEDEYLQSPGARIAYTGRLPLLTAADRLFAISETSKRDAVRLLGVPEERVDVIYAGSGDSYQPPEIPAPELAATLATTDRFAGLRPPYLLFTGGVDFRKNLDGLLDAYHRLDPDLRRAHQLVVVCKLDERSRQRLEDTIAQLGIAEDVLLTGFVTDRELVQLTQAAHLAVFPSRYEGFGLPVLEARRCGVPVICSANSSLSEIVLDAEAQFDADDVEDITSKLRGALTSPNVLMRLRAAEIPDRFTWAAAANKVADRLAELADRGHASGFRRRPARLAVLVEGPVPPQLIEQLRAAGSRWGRVWAGPDASTDLAFDESVHGPVDLVVRFITRHTPGATLDKLGERRETVVLLETGLGRAHGVGAEPFDVDAGRWIAVHHGDRYRTIAPGIADVGHEAARAAGMLGTGDLRRSHRVVTWHPVLADLLELDSGVVADVVPTIGPEPVLRPQGDEHAGDVDLRALVGSPDFTAWISRVFEHIYAAERLWHC